MQKRQENISGYLYVLDGLRAISLILIVMFHTWQQSWIFYRLQLTQKFAVDLTIFQSYGYLAIDSFFMLSGFCLFYPIARCMFGESEFKGWKDFFIKRARRIYPSYVIALAACIVVPAFSYWPYADTSFAEILKHTIYHLLFIHNIDTGTIGTMVSTAWTLPIEVHFYMLFPLLCIPFKKKPVLTFIGMCAAAIAVRLLQIAYGDVTTTTQAWTISYFDVFACGMLSAYFVVYARHKMQNLDKMKLLMTLISAVCIFAAFSMFLWIRKISFPQGVDGTVYFRWLYRGLFAALLAGFVFAACFSYDFWQKKIWGNKFFIFLSSISYSVYLWHQNIYIFLKEKGIPYSTSNPVMDDRPAMEGMTLICLASSLIISVLITRFIEQPIAKYGYKGCFEKITGFLSDKPKKK